MNFQSQSAKDNNLRLQQTLSVCSNLRRSLERGCYWKSFPLSVFRFPLVSLLRRSLEMEIGIIFSNFTKLPNLPKFSTTLNSPYLPLLFGAKQNLLSEKSFSLLRVKK